MIIFDNFTWKEQLVLFIINFSIIAQDILSVNHNLIVSNIQMNLFNDMHPFLDRNMYMGTLTNSANPDEMLS